MQVSFGKTLNNRYDWNNTTECRSFESYKKSQMSIDIIRKVRKHSKEVSDRALLSHSAKVELMKQRINLILNEIKK